MKKIKIPIYGGYLYITDMPREKANIKFGMDISEYTTACVFNHNRGFMNYVVWLGPKTTSAIIAHECVHLCDNVFSDIGAVPDVKNNEPYAYLLIWFHEEIEKYFNR